MDWKHVRPLLERILALPESDRAAALEAECGGDEPLLRKLRALLAAARDQSDLLEPPARTARPDGLATGDVIGAWRLVRPIGSGGMGEVWFAERAGSDFRQQVAVKVVKRGMDTDEVLRRFRRERKVLAALEHPNIPRLVDGGATDDGRPYLVMEYIEGQPLDQFLRRTGLDLGARLALFLEMCEAVQHAHECGIVHRDLKPTNVLITESGEPRLLDFGIAKLIEGDHGAETVDLTLTGQQLLTPRYASPEQVRGESATAATDVYALGLLLWELLVGRPALNLQALTQVDLQEAICERPIPRPSLSIEATQTGLKRALSGDLDTICMMALRKEPERRYASVRLLADDLRRHLEGHPVAARADTMTYRVSKFVRRNRPLVGGIVATFIVLVIGLIATYTQYREARRAAIASERIAYTASLEAAEAALREGLVGVARDKLELAPAALRGWEWEHLVDRLDRSSWSVDYNSPNLRHALALSSEGGWVACDAGPDLVVLRAGEERLRLPQAHPCSASWSPDSTQVAWCTPTGAVWIVVVAEGADSARRLLEGAGEPSTANDGCGIAWSPRGELLAFSHSDGSVRIFDTAMGDVRARFTAHGPTESPIPVTWHPDGRVLASCGWDETIQLYDAVAGEHLGGWHAHEMAVTSIDFDDDGARLVSASKDESIVVWEVATREALMTLRPHRREVKQVRFLPGGDELVSSDSAGSIRITAWRTSELISVLPGHDEAVLGLEVSGTVLASIDQGANLRIWDTDVQEVRTRRTCENTHSIRPSPDGRRFTIGSPDGHARIYGLDGTSIEFMHRLSLERGYVLSVDWSPDGKWIASAHMDPGCLALWDAATGTLERVIECDLPVLSVAFSPDGEQVTSLGSNGSGRAELQRWAVPSGELLATEELLVDEFIEPSAPRLALRPDGSCLAITLAWEMPESSSGSEPGLLDLALEGLRTLALSADGDLLAVSGWASCELRDPATGEVLAELPISGITALAFHPAGHRLALGIGERIELWDPDLRLRVATLQGHSASILDLSWTPDGRTLLSVDANGWMRVWETR